MLHPSTPRFLRRQDRPLRRPPAPPRPAGAVVVAATVSGDRLACTLVFDRPLTLAGEPPYVMDGEFEFGGYMPSGVAQAGPRTLAFTLDLPADPAGVWEIHRQAPWLATPVTTPQAGRLQDA
jgi:hypothetical protein